MGERSEKLREKLLKLYDVASELYLGEKSFFSGSNYYNPLVLFSLLSTVIRKNVLVYGDYGSGKTTACERIASLVRSIPLEFVQAATIHGHPEQTEEKMKATLDLGALEKEGKEVVRWKLTPFSPVTIVDEINRLPAGKQNILLNEVDRGVWSYRGVTLFLTKKPLFATVNYGDEGTANLIPPLADRFDVAVETGRVGVVGRRKVRAGVDDSFLRYPEFAEEMVKEVLEINGKKAEEYVRKKAEEFSSILSERFEEMGIQAEAMSPDELDEIEREVSKVELSAEAEMFLDYFSQEVYCQMSTRKDFSRCEGCHYSSFACSDVGIFSGRAEVSVVSMAKAIAWLEGREECSLVQLISVLPYCLWHRCRLNPARVIDVRDVEKEECDELFALKEVIDEVARRWDEHREYQEMAYRALMEGEIELLEKICERVSHPLFRSLARWV